MGVYVYAGPGNQAVNGTADDDDNYDMSFAGASGSFVDLQSGLAFSSLAGLYTLVSFENVKGSSGDDGLFGAMGANTFLATTGNDTIDGRDGIDTYDGSSATAGLQINLTSGLVSGAFSGTAVNIENVKTGSGDDTITASTSNNVIDGGAGFDTVAISSTVAGATVTFTLGTTWTVATAAGGTDTLTGVEKVALSNGNIWLVTDNAGLAKALAEANTGDVIKLANGEYSGNYTITSDGLTIESASGNAADVVLKGTFKTDNGIAPGTTVGNYLKTATSYSG